MLLISNVILIFFLIIGLTSGTEILSLTHQQFNLHRNYYILLADVNLASLFFGIYMLIFVEYFRKIIK
jgi:hypothetical protein